MKSPGGEQRVFVPPTVDTQPPRREPRNEDERYLLEMVLERVNDVIRSQHKQALESIDGIRAALEQGDEHFFQWMEEREREIAEMKAAQEVARQAVLEYGARAWDRERSNEARPDANDTEKAKAWLDAQQKQALSGGGNAQSRFSMGQVFDTTILLNGPQKALEFARQLKSRPGVNRQQTLEATLQMLLNKRQTLEVLLGPQGVGKALTETKLEYRQLLEKTSPCPDLDMFHTLKNMKDVHGMIEVVNERMNRGNGDPLGLNWDYCYEALLNAGCSPNVLQMKCQQWYQHPALNQHQKKNIEQFLINHNLLESS